MILRLLAFTAVAVLAITSPAFAAKGAKGQKGGGGRILTRFDRDHNGVIEGEEATRVQAAYAALSALDTDKNGQLSEAELAAAKVPMGKKGAKNAKAGAATTPAAPAAKPATPAPSGIPGEVK